MFQKRKLKRGEEVIKVCVVVELNGFVYSFEKTLFLPGLEEGGAAQDATKSLLDDAQANANAVDHGIPFIAVLKADLIQR